jgi:hypothetical protein
VCDDIGEAENLARKIQTLRGQLARLNRSGLDNATAQLKLSRKRAELEDVMKRGRSDAVRSAEMVRSRRG